MFDLFGIKKRKIRKSLTAQYNAKQARKHLRNVQRLRFGMESSYTKGVVLVSKYLENEGIPVPTTLAECDTLLEVLADVEH